MLQNFMVNGIKSLWKIQKKHQYHHIHQSIWLVQLYLWKSVSRGFMTSYLIIHVDNHVKPEIFQGSL